jgi:hypothetical protein
MAEEPRPRTLRAGIPRDAPARRGFLPMAGKRCPSCAILAAARERAMEKDRLLAFTDGVVAIIITIMVLS